MALGDVLAGFAKAAHEHNVNLLQMEYANRQRAGDLYAKMADNPAFTPEQRSWFMQGALHHYNFAEKVPNEYKFDSNKPEIKIPVNLPAQAPPPQEQPGALPMGTPGAPLGQPSPQVPPPQPPPGMMQQEMRSPFQPMSIAERTAVEGPVRQAQVEQAGATTAATGAAQVGTAQQSIIQTDKTLKDLYPNMDEETRQMLSMHMPISSFQATPVSDVPGSGVALPNDVAGNPIDPNDVYTVLHNRMGKPIAAYGKNTPSQLRVGVMNGKPTWFEFNSKTKEVKLRPDVDITPIQMLPTEVTSVMPKVVQQPDGSFKVEEVPGTSTRTKGGITVPGIPTGGIEAPTRPPITSSGQTIPVVKPTVTGGQTVGGRSLSPEQMENNQKASSAFDNAITRMAGALGNADKFSSLVTRAKIRLATDPLHEGRLAITGAVAPLSDEEAEFAKDYLSLGEDINLLRGVFQATGFRGPEAFQMQQAQRGLLTGDFKLFKGVLKNTVKASIDQLSAINKAMTRAGQPVQLSPGIAKAYILVYGDREKGMAAAARDGWK